MAQALPLAKLGGLFIKTLAKPLSKRIKHEFSRSPFTQNILVSIGQANHQLTSRLTIWSAGYKVRSIKPLDEDHAMKQGAEFVGEGFILTVSVGVLLYEYNSQATKARAKDQASKAKAKAERDELQAKLHTLDIRLKALEEVVQQNSNSLLNLTGKKYKAPNAEEMVPIDSDGDGIPDTIGPARPHISDLPGEVSPSQSTGDAASSRPSWLKWPPWGR